MRIMAIDYGDARTGLAVSDPTGLLAGEAHTIESHNPDKAGEEIARQCALYGVEELVLGCPRNMDGTSGARVEKSEAFAALLREKTGLPVTLWDERRTTVEAHEILTVTGNHGKKRKAKVDAVAATLILEGYLTFKHLRG